ncbi:MAG: endonuclease [Spirochaetales bacterium]|jgi:endonuclease/exonuclease/phosphatase family metal-dependent hydrolase|nr:endonuclease [Spirochaetales bacterium]
MNTAVFLFFYAFFPLFSCSTLDSLFNDEPKETIKVYSFNIQIFGAAKMAKPEVAEILAEIVSRADLVAVQEVRSISPEPVSRFMALLPPAYSYVIGPREGRSSSREQYWVIYNTEKLSVVDTRTWPDEEDRFERDPFGVYFQTKDKLDFILIDNHLRPSSAEEEINALPDVVSWFQEFWGEQDVFVVGDFNADGIYYDESLLENVFPRAGYTIIITNDLDTTVAESDNTYDRFIITSSAREDYTGKFGVLRFDEVYDFSAYSVQPKEVSDHYPVWAEFRLDKDTD